jgi:hypothetical protein
MGDILQPENRCQYMQRANCQYWFLGVNSMCQQWNHVDVSAMEGVADHLQDSIEAAMGGLPCRGMFGMLIHRISAS